MTIARSRSVPTACRPALADWITTSAEGSQLVRKVDSAGFAMNLDTAGMTLSDESLSVAINGAAGTLRHFHASAPNLLPVGDDALVDHASAVSALRAQAFSGFVSIEMRDAGMAAIPAAMARIGSVYHDV